MSFETKLNEGIFTIPEFFNEEFVHNWLDGGVISKAKLINASGVFFHLEELHSVCRGIKQLLDDEGVFVVDPHHELYRGRLKRYRNGYYKIPWEKFLVNIPQGDLIIIE